MFQRQKHQVFENDARPSQPGNFVPSARRFAHRYADYLCRFDRKLRKLDAAQQRCGGSRFDADEFGHRPRKRIASIRKLTPTANAANADAVMNRPRRALRCPKFSLRTHSQSQCMRRQRGRYGLGLRNTRAGTCPGFHAEVPYQNVMIAGTGLAQARLSLVIQIKRRNRDGLSTEPERPVHHTAAG